MSILTVLIIFFGILCYLYFFWDRLKEDYTSNLIFTTAFFVLIGLGVFYALARFLVLPNVNFSGFQGGFLFWISLIGSGLGFTLGVWRFKLRFFETLEGYAVGLLYLMLAVFLTDTFVNSSLNSLAAATAIALLLTLFYFLETKYKNLSWYRSGKVGFSGLVVVGLFFMLRALVAIFFPFVLSFLGKFETIPAAICAFALFLTVYNLSQQKQ